VNDQRDATWPAHWGVTTLGELATKVTSGSRDWKPFYNRGSGVFILTQNVRRGRLDLSDPFHVDPPVGDPARVRSAVEPDDLLINIVGSVGTVARVPAELPEHYVCQSVALVRLSDPTLAEFLELYLNAPTGGQRHFAGKTYGIGRPHLSLADIKATPIPIPPGHERAEISRAVQDYEARIETGLNALRSAHRDVERFRNACLAAAFEIGTQAELQVLGDIAAVQSGVTKGRHNSDNLIELPYIRTANVQAGFLDLEIIKTLPVTPAQREKHRLAVNDVLVLEGGDADKVGRGWIWEGQIAECLHQNHVYAVRPSSDLLPRYLAYYLNAPQARRYFLSCAKQTVNLASINKTQLKALPVPVPPVNVQIAVVEQLDRQFEAASRFAKVLESGSHSADRLRAAVLQRTLRGGLSHPRTARDEEARQRSGASVSAA
jgi:type I restriction enzyme S subunit